ncbi:50S ribosomal protein L29 [endosymbiont of Pachyrhynchus infernalis]|uniref:50S ribosomal protein L29 n=1 Tax=endosymbiont of Pachyrhynchus infernalis TaxID=1971488 RepID=UPI000DC6FB98|nr:50S ribosomal protein L29 [endosymbiont of Pachyrhynchus infernalis]BBA84840.1 50S ribosomal protein L29 [endosymbiont of Pachyrhynchus infernalis]
MCIDNKELYNKLNLLIFEKFKLKIKIKNNNFKKNHLLRKIKKDIAKINTLISINNKK